MNYFDEEQTTEVTPDPEQTPESTDESVTDTTTVGEPEVKTEEVPTEEGGDENVSQN